MNFGLILGVKIAFKYTYISQGQIKSSIYRFFGMNILYIMFC